MRRFTLFLAAAALAIGPVALADNTNDDSASDHSTGFTTLINDAQGVMIRVPVNKDGEENTDMAEMRVHTGDNAIDDASDIGTAWEKGKDISGMPQVDDINSDSDTSACWGWRRWRNRGWQTTYHYRSYRPTYRYSDYHQPRYPRHRDRTHFYGEVYERHYGVPVYLTRWYRHHGRDDYRYDLVDSYNRRYRHDDYGNRSYDGGRGRDYYDDYGRNSYDRNDRYDRNRRNDRYGDYYDGYDNGYRYYYYPREW